MIKKVMHVLYMIHDQCIIRIYTMAGTAVAQLLRRCATNRKVAGSIPDSVTGIFH
jgi:hypothetical protein